MVFCKNSGVRLFRLFRVLCVHSTLSACSEASSALGDRCVMLRSVCLSVWPSVCLHT